MKSSASKNRMVVSLSTQEVGGKDGQGSGYIAFRHAFLGRILLLRGVQDGLDLAGVGYGRNAQLLLAGAASTFAKLRTQSHLIS
jgi:hypothetical protein